MSKLSLHIESTDSMIESRDFLTDLQHLLLCRIFAFSIAWPRGVLLMYSLQGNLLNTYGTTDIKVIDFNAT